MGQGGKRGLSRTKYVYRYCTTEYTGDRRQAAESQIDLPRRVHVWFGHRQLQLKKVKRQKGKPRSILHTPNAVSLEDVKARGPSAFTGLVMTLKNTRAPDPPPRTKGRERRKVKQKNRKSKSTKALTWLSVGYPLTTRCHNPTK